MRANLLVRVFGGLVVLAATGAISPATAQSKSYFCSASDHFKGTVWITPVRPAGPDGNALAEAWLKYVRANLVPNAGPNGATCDVGTADYMATSRKNRPSRLQASKVVEIDWSFWKGAETEAAAAALNKAAAAGQYVLCYSSPDQSPVYFSSDFHIDLPLGPDPQSTVSDGGASTRRMDELKAEFLGYLKADRGYHYSGAYPDYCTGRISAAEVDGDRDRLHQRFPQLKFVETGWQPGMKPTAPPAAAPAPAPPPPAPSAYEKALQAQRPASNVPPAAPPADDGRTYAWCWVQGHPPHKPSEAGRSVFYVTGIFPAEAGKIPVASFEQEVSAAHPTENVRGATCTAPQPMAATTTARDNEVAARKRSPYQTVTEVGWRPK